MAFYNYDRICSYNALLNFILSPRGNGKSYGAKERCIKAFLKNGSQFIYVRRYKTELKKKNQFFDDIKMNFPDNEFKVNGNGAYIDGKLCGHFLSLSTAHNEKSTSYPKVTNIIFDEFIIGKNSKYLDGEVETFLDLYETVARCRDGKDGVKAYLLANMVSIVNPYFLYFNCVPKDDRRFATYQDGLIVVEQFTDNDFIEMKKATNFGKLVQGTTYGNYAIENKSLLDNNKFIMKKMPKDSKFIFSVIYRGNEYGVWYSFKETIFHCNSKVQKTSLNRFAITKEDHNIDLLMYNQLSNFPMFSDLVRYYRIGSVRFEDITCKSFIYSVMRYMNIK